MKQLLLVIVLLPGFLFADCHRYVVTIKNNTDYTWRSAPIKTELGYLLYADRTVMPGGYAHLEFSEAYWHIDHHDSDDLNSTVSYFRADKPNAKFTIHLKKTMCQVATFWRNANAGEILSSVTQGSEYARLVRHQPVDANTNAEAHSEYEIYN